jgi:hypothetical protein
MRDDTVRDNTMRDNAIPDNAVRDDPAGFEAPRTDQIPAAPQDPGFTDARTDPAGQLAAEPGYADPATDPGVPPATGEPGFADRATDHDVPPTTGEPGFADAAPAAGRTDPASSEDSGEVLFGGDDVERFREQWRDLQAGFVDNPTEAVRGADQLVDEVLRKLTEVFAAHKQELETQWQGGETEELRVALRRYRSFFDQLLNA